MTYLVDGLGRGTFGGNNATTDAFARLRTSDPVSLFDSQHQYDASPLFWEASTTGTASATHEAASASVKLTVGADANDQVIWQTRQYMRYQPGKSQLIMMTFDWQGIATHLRARIGYFDASNGVFLQRTGGTTSLILRTGASDTNKVDQTSWNIDTLNGSGVSGVTLDISKAQLFFVDLEWLSVGRVRCGFFFGGRPYYVHEFNHANSGAKSYMATANLPIRAEFTNVSSGTGDDIFQLCCTVISEGGFETDRGIPFSASTGVTVKAVSTTRLPLVSIRPKGTFGAGALVMRGTIVPTSVDAISGNQNAIIETVYNGSLTNASFASVDSSSVTEFDTAATAITGGIVVDQFYIAAGGVGAGSYGGAGGGTVLSRLPLTLDIAGSNPIPLSICARGFVASATVAASVKWVEYR